MQKIEIKPNDQTRIGEVFCYGPMEYKILGVGDERVFYRKSCYGQKTIELSDNIDTFNFKFEFIEKPPIIDWSKVNWVRCKINHQVGFLLKFWGERLEISIGGEPSKLFPAEHWEPIKFTQTLKVGDMIKAKNEDCSWLVQGIHPNTGITCRLIGGRHPVFIYHMDVHFVHSDDWEFVNTSAEIKVPPETLKAAQEFKEYQEEGFKEFRPNEKMKEIFEDDRKRRFYNSGPIEELVNTSANVAKNEFGDWVEKVCSEKKQTRLAPALLSYDKGCSYFPSSKFYSSLEKAEEDNKSIDKMPEILWPAILNQDGFYTVPEETDGN